MLKDMTRSMPDHNYCSNPIHLLPQQRAVADCVHRGTARLDAPVALAKPAGNAGKEPR